MMKANEESQFQSLSLTPYLREFHRTLKGRDRSRFQSAFTQLKRLLGKEVVIPNRRMVWDLPNRLRHFLREEGFDAESVKNYSYWTTKALKSIEANCPEVVCNVQGPNSFPRLTPDPSDQQRRFYKGYKRFVKWCSPRRINPDRLTKQEFREYQHYLLKTFKYETARSYYSALVTFWKTRSERWELPLLDLPEMERKGPNHYGLNRKKWPMGVKEDFDRFFRFSRGEELIPGRVSKHYRDRSAEKGYANVLSTYLGYLVHILGRDISMCGLRELIADEASVREYIAWHKAERSEGQDANTHQRTFERFAIILDELWSDPIAATYKEYVAQLDPTRKEPRFSDTLIPFKRLLSGALKALQDARAFAARAEKTGSAKLLKKAAIVYHDALLFALLVLRPLREANIIDLFIGKILVQRLDRHYDIVVPSAQEKGRKLYRIKFPDVLEEYLEEYLAKWRPLLNLKGDTRLFLTSKGGRLTPKLLGDRTSRLGEKYLGIQKLNPHFFRALTVSSYLTEYPNQFEMARQLLGHRRLDTTLKHYVHIHALHASRRAAQFARDTCPEFRRLETRFSRLD